jgi:tetratricopeptide (TPR) repeat protein
MKTITLTILSLFLLSMTGHLEAKNKDSFEKGLQLMEQSKYAEAINAFDSALKRDPGNPNIWDRRGTAYLSLKNYYQAINDYTVAINLSPQNGFFYMERALAYFGTGNMNAMTNDLIIAARLGDPNAQYTLVQYGISW